MIDPALNSNNSRDFVQAVITIEALQIAINLLLGGQGRDQVLQQCDMFESLTKFPNCSTLLVPLELRCNDIS